jgi:hypothetical protein
MNDGYYFMFEIGWFMDLLIPTLVRIHNGALYLVGSKVCQEKNLKPCCIPCGGAEDLKKYSFDDTMIKAFRMADSLVPVTDKEDLAGELERTIESKVVHDMYFNTRAKKMREATGERIQNDYKVLARMAC